MNYLLLLLFPIFLFSIDIIPKPIKFSEKRVSLTKEYIKNHYNLEVENINIIPKIIVVHHTGFNSFKLSFSRFYEEVLPQMRTDISKASLLNVSAQYMVDRDGKIYSLMPDNIMGRHTIGLNYSSIGIENVGAENLADNLTTEQLKSNVTLIKYLRKKYSSIVDVIGHYEYRDYENSALWLEVDKNYRTIKHDPSKRFMKELKKALSKKEK